MYRTPVIFDKWLQKEDRRSHPRRRCEPLDYTDFGPDNGGILLDFSEGGVGFQGVKAVAEGQIIHLKFALPGTGTNIEADARVARSNDSRTGGGLRFVVLSEDVRQQVRAWVSGVTTGTPPPGTFKTGGDGRPASAAVNPPELSTADSAAMERARIFVAARISGVPEAKPDAAATPALSSAEQGAGDESLESTESLDVVAATADLVGIDLTSIDHVTFHRAQSLPELLEPLPAPEPLLPLEPLLLPEQAAIAKASTSAPDPPAPESTGVSSPAPAAAVAATGAPETPRQTLLSTQLLGLQTPGTKDTPSEGISDMREKLPTRQEIERRAYEIYAKRGGQSGNDLTDWLAAEKELTSHHQRKAAEPSSSEHRQGCTATKMLLDFYGLRAQPFGMSPDPAYLYGSRTHGEAFASLLLGIHCSRGFFALIAEPGMGKTTLLYQLLENLRDSARTVFVFQTQCDSRELFQYVLHELDVDAQGMGLVAMHNRLNELLFEEMLAGKRFVLVVDEAQNLDESVLETVRMLSNFETDHTKLLQIVLAGQPRLAAKLAQPQLSQLRQRIAVLTHLEPFTAADTAGYMDHRLRVAGYRREPLFAPDAVGLIAHQSRGIPRNINNICYNSLLMAYLRGHGTVTSENVQEAVARLDIESLAPQPMRTADPPVAPTRN
jgi:type II secretory pathway predicted ATPase ExeA